VQIRASIRAREIAITVLSLALSGASYVIIVVVPVDGGIGNAYRTPTPDRDEQ